MSLENLHNLLQVIIDSAGESWTYAIFWKQYSPISLLGWGDGYYKGGEDDPSSYSAVEQEHRKKVWRQLNSMISVGSSDDDAADKVVTDTEWFFLTSMTQSFVNGAGLPGRSFFTNEAVWITGKDPLASSTCERARKAQLLGLQTMVCIPLPNGVVEFGSSDLILQRPDLMDQVRVLFNATDQIGAPQPPNVGAPRIELPPPPNVGAAEFGSSVHQSPGFINQLRVLFHGSNATNQIEAPPPTDVQQIPLSQRMGKENQSTSGTIVILPLMEESNVPYDFQGQEGDYESEPEFHLEEGDTGIGVSNKKKGQFERPQGGKRGVHSSSSMPLLAKRTRH